MGEDMFGNILVKNVLVNVAELNILNKMKFITNNISLHN